MGIADSHSAEDEAKIQQILAAAGYMGEHALIDYLAKEFPWPARGKTVTEHQLTDDQTTVAMFYADNPHMISIGVVRVPEVALTFSAGDTLRAAIARARKEARETPDATNVNGGSEISPAPNAKRR